MGTSALRPARPNPAQERHRLRPPPRHPHDDPACQLHSLRGKLAIQERRAPAPAACRQRLGGNACRHAVAPWRGSCRAARARSKRTTGSRHGPSQRKSARTSAPRSGLVCGRSGWPGSGECVRGSGVRVQRAAPTRHRMQRPVHDIRRAVLDSTHAGVWSGACREGTEGPGRVLRTSCRGLARTAPTYPLGCKKPRSVGRPSTL